MRHSSQECSWFCMHQPPIGDHYCRTVSPFCPDCAKLSDHHNKILAFARFSPKRKLQPVATKSNEMMTTSVLNDEHLSKQTMQPEHQHCVVGEEPENPVQIVPFVMSTIQHTTTRPNTYGTTNISGSSNVIQGNVYISSATIQVKCRHLHAAQSTTAFRNSTCKSERLGNSVTRTKTQRRGGWQLVPYVTLTQKTVVKANGQYTESSWIVAINVLQLCLLTIGLACHLSGLTFLRPRLQRIVPDDAPFMMACRRGDIITMRSLISQGLGAYSDITKDNLTPLYFALGSGVAAAIEEALHHCEDIDATFGSNQTSALAWALYHRNVRAVRMILARDADLQHISLLGWTPVFYLWRDQTELQDSSLELLQALQTSDPKGFRRSLAEVVDIGELSLLQRVTILGTPDEVQWLIDCGADLHLRTGQLEWTAMFHAAYDGRLENLRVLSQVASESIIQDRDLRGWSLLHVAAAEGQTKIVQWLLESGTDPFAKSQPSFIDVPEALVGLECTPAEVARAEGVENEESYWMAVKKVCGNELLLKGKCL